MIDEKKLIEVIKDHKEKVKTPGLCGESYAMAHDHIIDIILILASKNGDNNG